jgi:hypothetical protein
VIHRNLGSGSRQRLGHARTDSRTGASNEGHLPLQRLIVPISISVLHDPPSKLKMKLITAIDV